MLSTSHSIPASGKSGTRSQERDAFFLRACQEIRARFPDLIIILTGGFRSRNAINKVLEGGACSAIGIGRPAIKYPDLPAKILVSKEGAVDGFAHFDVEAAPSPGWIAKKIKSVGAGAESKYWASMMHKL